MSNVITREKFALIFDKMKEKVFVLSITKNTYDNVSAVIQISFENNRSSAYGLLTVGFATVSGKRPSTSILSSHVAYNQQAKNCSGFSNSTSDSA